MSESNIKFKKKKGIIRWNALIPLFVFIVLIGVYFKLFFDNHLKSLIEWGGFKALGTELNISSIKTSFRKGSVEINKLELTNREKPELNSIELSQIVFDVNTDAILRLKYVIDKMAVDGIQFLSKRSYPGKVAPPPPPSNEPGFADQLKSSALNKLEKDNKSNLLSDIAGFLKNGDLNAQLKNLESQIASKKMAEELNKKWEQKRVEWDATIKTLPNQKDLDQYKVRFNGIKYKDFKNIEEVNSSVNEFISLKKDVDTKIQVVNDTKNKLTTDVASIQADYKTLEQQIKADIDFIKTKFKIPKIDAAQFAKSLFMGYLIPYAEKLDRYKLLIEKYLPPKYSKMITGKIENVQAKLTGKKIAETEAEIDDSIQPQPRAKGIFYEFPILNGYPQFWIKEIGISSQSNKQADYGDFKGQITNVTSNQRQIKKPTELKINGDFKSQNLFGIKAYGLFNNMPVLPIVSFDFDVASYLLKNLELIKTDDVGITIPSSKNSIAIKLKTEGFKTYIVDFKNDFKEAQFITTAKDKIVNEILNGTLASINNFDVQASAKGALKDLDINISSSLGQKLETAFSALLKKKLDEVNTLVQQKINEEIEKQKKQLNEQIGKLTNGYLTDFTQAESKFNELKGQAQERIEVAKKDLENKAKAEVENKAKQEGQKALDDIKKKLGF